MGGTLLLAEVTVIVLMLAVPRSVGVPEHAVLTSVQRGILGGVSIILLIEAVLYGVTDIGIYMCNQYLTYIQNMYMLNFV